MLHNQLFESFYEIKHGMKMIYSVTECSIIYSKIVTNTFTPCCKNLNVMKVITDKNNNLIPLKGSG